MTRYTKLDADGNPVTSDATGHPAVIDTTTGLVWTAVELTNTKVNHRIATQLAADCRLLGHDDWRLPTVEELFAIGDRTRRLPTIDTDAFPNTKSSWYWSSSLCVGGPEYAWIVGFHGGSAFIGYYGNDGAFVRAVRGPRLPEVA